MTCRWTIPRFLNYSSGEKTNAIFQFESDGMKKHMRDLIPDRFEHLIAMNALYRPGPIAYIPNFIRRKNGQEEITYDLPELEEYLADTYGITVYQEQVMLLSQKLAGFTKGQADTLRKAMGKKQIETLNKMKGDFMKGGTERGWMQKSWKRSGPTGKLLHLMHLTNPTRPVTLLLLTRRPT